MTLKIDKGIPCPSARGTYSLLGEMEVGDSVFFAGDTALRVRGRVNHYTEKFGYVFRARTVVEDGVKGIRVWRTK